MADHPLFSFFLILKDNQSTFEAEPTYWQNFDRRTLTAFGRGADPKVLLITLCGR
jgi:hypothetical protein